MHFAELLELGRTLLFSHGWSIVWRVGLLTFLGGALGMGTLLVCHRKLYRKGYLKLALSNERYFEAGVLALWVFTIPTFAVACGTLVGVCWAGQHLIETEHVGERLGKSVFKTIAASVASAHLETSVDARAKLADELMKGSQKVSVKELSVYTSHHLGKVSAGRIWGRLPVSSERLERVTGWCIEKTVDGLAYAQLGGKGDVVYQLVAEVANHDRATDNDGLITVEEISVVACKTYGDRGMRGLWIALILQFLLPLLLALATLAVTPPFMAWGVRGLVAWRARWRDAKPTAAV